MKSKFQYRITLYEKDGDGNRITHLAFMVLDKKHLATDPDWYYISDDVRINRVDIKKVESLYETEKTALSINPYEGYEHLKDLSVKDRIEAFKETALMFLNNGKTRQEILDCANLLRDEEKFEAAQACLDAIKEFESETNT
jgi:hypothetical protein